jgi:hypothetical protein
MVDQLDNGSAQPLGNALSGIRAMLGDEFSQPDQIMNS